LTRQENCHQKATVLHHNDADGFGAAFAIWSAGYQDATYLPVQYDQPVPDIPEDTKALFIVDFSYDRATCDALAEKYQLTLIDHHKTAATELEGAPYAIFDMTRSGCELAWDHFMSPLPMPAILQYVADRDMWRWSLEQSKEINAYISTLPDDFDTWAAFDLTKAREAGEAILAFQQQQLARSLRDVQWLDIAGYRVPVINTNLNQSELGNLMCERFPDAKFSASYYVRGDGKRNYSLRSIGDFDVSAIAKQLGGGGHRNAAGFTQ